MDSLPIEVHGHQPKAEWNGHYRGRIYHPLVTSVAETGDMLDARLRPGNVATADGALDVILDVVTRAQADLCDVAMVRIDAGFPSATLLGGLEARGIDYVARLRANPALDRLAALSSTNRPKAHWRGRHTESATPAVDAFACNEVRLLISVMAYQLMHIARRAMTRATGTGWSLRRLRERVLRAGARIVLSARRMTLALSSSAAPFWSLLWPRIIRMHWSGP